MTLPHSMRARSVGLQSKKEVEMNILTITLNPAFDVHYKMKSLQLHKENYVDSTSVFAGGKGINVARALKSNGVDCTAYVVLGRENADRFVSMLDTDGVSWSGVYCDGKIRENLTIHVADEPETRISLDDFFLSKETLDQLDSMLKNGMNEEPIVIFSGRIPRGLTKQDVLCFLKKLQTAGAKVCVDCNSFSFEDLLEIKPFLVKPNEQEAEKFCKTSVRNMDEALRAAKAIHTMGIENVIISMGGGGAAFAGKQLSCVAVAPKISPLSTVGAGDSMVAGFVAAFALGMDIDQCLVNAVSFGTAACLTEGTLPPLPGDVMNMKTLTRLVF